MLKLFDIFKTGFITIFTSPFWVLFLVYKLIICLGLFFYNSFKAIILFFQGKSIFVSKEDKAIKVLKEQDEKVLEARREEAMRHVDY